MTEVGPMAHIEPGAQLEQDVAVAPFAVVQNGVSVGAGTTIGPGAVLYAGTRIGERCLVEPGAVLGKAPRLRAGSSAAGAALNPLVIGDGVSVCSGAVVYAGAAIAD